MCVSEPACWCVPLQGAAARCFRSGVCALELACWRRCTGRCKMLLSVLFGAWLLRVSLQGASRQGAAARCCRQWNLVAQGRCKVPVEGAASRCVLSECCLRFGAWLLVLLHVAARLPLQGVAVQRRTFELDCWCCGRRAPRFVSVIPL